MDSEQTRVATILYTLLSPQQKYKLLENKSSVSHFFLSYTMTTLVPYYTVGILISLDIASFTCEMRGFGILEFQGPDIFKNIL